MKKLILLLTILILGNVSNAQYCLSNGQAGTSHEITNVSLTGITGALNNSTPCNSLVGTQGTATGNSIVGRYSNFVFTTGIPIPKLVTGKTYTLYVKSKNCLNATGGIKMAFFDWNHDNDFLDSNEKVIINTTYTLDSLNSADVYVPYGSYQGTTRMRIVYRFATNLSAIQSCDTGLYAGETEDYNVSLVNCNQQGYLNEIISGNTTILTTVVAPYDSLNMPVGFVWTRNQVLMPGQTSSSISFLTGADSGLFCVKITMQNGCVYEPCISSPCLPANNTTSTDSICWSNTKFCTGTPAGGTWSVVSGGGTCSGPDYNHPVVTSPVYVTIRYTKAANGNCPITFSDKSFWVLPCSTPCNPVTTTKVDSPCIGTTFMFNGMAITSTGSYWDTLKTTKGCDSFILQYLVFKSCGSPKCSEFKKISYTKNGTIFYFTSSGPASVPAPFSVRYNWTFSNGSTSTQKNPTITSFTSFPAWARLTICIDSGNTTICCDSSMRDSIMGCQMYCNITKIGDTLRVNGYNGTAPYSYNWGNGVTGQTKNVANQSGIYTVTVIDGAGCSSTCSFTIVPQTPCKGREIIATVNGNVVVFTTNIPASFMPTYTWTYNDTNSVVNGPTVTRIYPGTGFYYVKLYFCLRDSAQNIICCDSIMRTVGIYPPCNVKAKFGWAATSNGGTYQFVDSTSPAGTNYTYQWYFGDGTSSTAKNPIKTYATNGTKTICMIVTKYANTNNQVCRDTLCKTLIVNNVNPCNRFEPNFNWTNTGGGYQFNNTTNMTNFNLVSVAFNISTGASYTYNNPVHTFINNGTYSVTMTMTVFDVLSGTNCTKTITKVIAVNTSICGCLKANFNYSRTGMTANFNSLSTCDSGASYLYKFGNGTTATTKNPSHTYSLPGLYKVVLIITRTVGSTTCVDSTVKYIQITTPNPCKDSGYISTQTCQDYHYPVCGCDTMTYKNYCEASKAGVKQYSMGPCSNDTNYVKICGYVYNDFNKNCAYDTTDGRLSGIPIKITKAPNFTAYAYTNANGYYSIYLLKGTYSLTQILTNQTFPKYQLCPANNGSISVSASTGGMTYCNNNFYDTANTCQDLSTSIHRIANITPGFTSMKSIKYQNNGATPISGVVLKYRFLSSLTVKSTTTATYTVSGNVITWNLGTLAPYSIGYKSAHFNTPITLALGTTVIDSVWIEPISSDCNPSNNYATNKDTCVGSWDPNDKSAYPANDIEQSVKQLDYFVRFQNTGTAPAHNVLIEDQIDDNFDRSSLNVKASSHSMNHFFDDAGKLFFEFANIMLPDSGTDYDASQGYVAYSLKLKDGLPIGTQLKNTAHIFFDFNEAVVTNTTVNTIVLKSTNGVQNQGKDLNISIFPNPTSDRATILVNLTKASQVSYSLYDLQGKVILASGTTKPQIGEYAHDLSLEGLSKGIYVLNIVINGQATSFKLVKE